MYFIHQRTETVLREGLRKAIVSCYIFFVSSAALDVFCFGVLFGGLLTQLEDQFTDRVYGAALHTVGVGTAARAAQ